MDVCFVDIDLVGFVEMCEWLVVIGVVVFEYVVDFVDFEVCKGVVVVVVVWFGCFDVLCNVVGIIYFVYLYVMVCEYW